MHVFTPLTLHSGNTLPNRIVKAAMEENMADADHAPSAELIRLYQAWAQGGAGLLITGNVMVDRTAMTGAGGVVLEDASHIDRFALWAQTVQQHGAHIWMQLNHPGRQMPKDLGQTTYAPSAISLNLGSLSKQFAPPQALSTEHIEAIIERFVHSAQLAEQAGFNGVQIHAAHGYLLSQFLSPLSNVRNDDWGGDLRQRARLLLEIVRRIRAVVAPTFAVAVKLNSADFQRGGFSADDAKTVVMWLGEWDVDVVELSGGSYEAPAMQGQSRDGKSLAREAYFLEFAQDIASVAKMPLMVTGGIRRVPVAEQVLDSGVALVGMATALALNPKLPQAWRRAHPPVPMLKPIAWRNKPLASAANMAVVRQQLKRISRGAPPQADASAAWALLRNQWEMRGRSKQYRAWVSQTR